MSLPSVPLVTIVETRPAPMSGAGVPLCKRCGEHLRIKFTAASPRVTIEAFRAQDIQVHWLTGERLLTHTLDGFFHRECAMAELADLEPGVEAWAAGGEAFNDYMGRGEP